ncbi:MAG TPA: hypothetical protein VN420_03605 [Candidatus Fimivivens sp.]|nr:hypothetical protein [Candidatus Fimivivens sp.]
MKKLSEEELYRLVNFEIFIVKPSIFFCTFTGLFGSLLGILSIDRMRVMEASGIVSGFAWCIVVAFFDLIPWGGMNRKWWYAFSDDGNGDNQRRPRNILFCLVLLLSVSIAVHFFSSAIGDALRGNVENGIAPLVFFTLVGGLVVGELVLFFRNFTGAGGMNPDDPNFMNWKAYHREEKRLLEEHHGEYAAYGGGKRLAVGADYETVIAEAKQKKRMGSL